MRKEKRTFFCTGAVSSFVLLQGSYNPASRMNTTVELTAVDSSAEVTNYHHMHNHVMILPYDLSFTSCCALE